MAIFCGCDTTYDRPVHLERLNGPYHFQEGITYTFEENITLQPVKDTSLMKLMTYNIKDSVKIILRDSVVIRDSVRTVTVYDSAGIKIMAEFFRLVMNYQQKK